MAVGCVPQERPDRATCSRIIIGRIRRIGLRRLQEHAQIGEVRRHVHVEQPVERLRPKVLGADILARRQPYSVIEHELLGDVAEPFVEPRGLVSRRIVHVQAAPEVDEVLVLVRERADR